MKVIADYIYSFLMNSSKRHIFITGSQKSGKSLLFNELKILLDIKDILLSYKDIDNNIYMSDGKHKGMIGKYNKEIRYYNNPMECIKDGFYDIGIPFFNNQNNNIWVGIDEIGFLESKEEQFLSEIRNILNKKRVCAVLRKQDLPFINELKQREDAYIIDMDNICTRIGCIVMASGLSQRYGKNKLFEVYNGKTFIENTLELTDNLFYKRIVVTRDKDVKTLCETKNIPVLYHNYPYRNQAINLGISHIEDIEACMFINCDQPLLTKNSIIKMIHTCINNKNKIIRLSYNQIYGNPIIFPQRLFKELKNLPDKKGGNTICNKYNNEIIYVQCSNIKELKDIDTREDYINILK